MQSVREILKSRINAPLAWGVLLLTLVLTVLFYFSQKNQEEVYGRYEETLSEYKFFASRVMQRMERVRVFSEDTSVLMSSLRSLRETAVAAYAASEKTADWLDASGTRFFRIRDVGARLGRVDSALRSRPFRLAGQRAHADEGAVSS